MIKGLEAFERTRYRVCEDYTIEQYVSDYKTVQKELKVLEIIIKKNVDIRHIKWVATLSGYNMYKDNDEALTQEEYELLKEVLL